MAKNFVLTFIADDRPGVVDRISEAVDAHGGNWMESRMAHLAEKFAGVATVKIADDRADALKAALEALTKDGFHIAVETAGKAAAPEKGSLLYLDLVGPDHPGIVHEISHCLAEHQVSVEEMNTYIDAAPVGGGTLFHAHAKIRLPTTLSEDEISDALGNLANALMVDIELGEEDAAAS